MGFRYGLRGRRVVSNTVSLQNKRLFMSQRGLHSKQNAASIFKYKMHGFPGMMGKMDFTALNESAQRIEALSDARVNKDMDIPTFQPQSLHGNL